MPDKGSAYRTAEGSVAPAVRTVGLTKRYLDNVAVDRLDLEVAPGEVFGLLGPNGAGKTTTILMLLGLTEPSDGTAEVAGLDPARNPLLVKQHVGYLPDNVGFYGTLTGRENLRYTARLNGLDRKGGDARIADLLGQVGLNDAADRRVDTYSRGMRQRLGIADALVKDPSIVILDEPTIAIDPEGVQEILAIIRSLARDRGAAVLLASHLLHQVETICDRVGIFVAGRMVAQGSKQKLAEEFEGGVSVTEVVVEPGHDPARVIEVLTAIPGVHEVVAAGPLDAFEVHGAEDLRALVSKRLAGADIGLVELHRKGAALDEIYRRWFEGKEEAA